MESNNEKLNQMKTNVNFENLKSVYFLKKIFEYMKTNKYLTIVKYNKKLQKRLNLNINDFKDYSQLYSPIEIELNIVNNKYHNKQFINIFDDFNLKYYHIYFDDSNEEIKRTKMNDYTEAKVIKIIIDYQIKSFKSLFSSCNCIREIHFKKFFRINITNMEAMFYGCSSLRVLNLSNFNTHNVTNMNLMFAYCSLLKELNLSNFNTNKVTNMCGMFQECSSLRELNVSNFNTNNVTNMSGMFWGCSLLKELNLSNFDTTKVTDMRYMFSDCTSLRELNVSNFNTNNVIYNSNMFDRCSKKLIKIGLI